MYRPSRLGLLVIIGPLLALFVSSCGTSNNNSGSYGNGQATNSYSANGSGQSSTSGGSGGGGVTGTITWPDGTPARNIELTFYPQVFSGSSGTSYVEARTDQSGAYSIQGCPCDSLVGFVSQPAGSGGPYEGGRACWILMTSPSGYEGVRVDDGQTLNWRVLDIPCNQNYYSPSDAGRIQGLMNGIQQQLNQGVDPNNIGNDGGYAGPWQAERDRSGG